MAEAEKAMKLLPEDDDSVRHGVRGANLQDKPAYPPKCKVSGLERNYVCSSKGTAEFTIVTFDENGVRKHAGGESFFIAIRGAGRARARVTDQEDGTYVASWHPPVSGAYAIVVSLFGEVLPGCPFLVNICDNSPYAPKCAARGGALHRAIARTPSSFEVRYVDRANRVAPAVDLDVFVVPEPESGAGHEGQPSAWHLATQPAEQEKEANVVTRNEESEQPAGMVGLPKKRTGRRVRRGSAAGAVGDAGKKLAELAGASATGGAAPAPADDNNSGVPSDVREPMLAGSADMVDDGYGSPDELHSWSVAHAGDRVSVRHRAFPIQVGDRPLIVRRDASLSSEEIGTLHPEQVATVIEERISVGETRSYKSTYVRACVLFELKPTPAQQQDAGSGDGELTQIGTQEHSNGSGNHNGSSSTVTDGTAKATTLAPATLLLQSLQKGDRRAQVDGISILDRRGARDARASSLLDKLTAPKTMVGWATLRKHGKNLVTSRVRIDPWVRQQAGLLWRLQQLNDKLQLSLQTEAAMLDPTGVGFAFGGVTPGQLHSKGVLHELHKVHYSIDRVGRYLLHVRLRQSARPVPGSPFALVVRPGVAHQSTTFLAPATQPLIGEVGVAPEDGCSLVLQTYDRVGNLCNEGCTGNADDKKTTGLVSASCASASVTSECEDNGDGTYRIQWQSKQSGLFDVRVMINNQNVRGSPMKIRLVSTRPSISRIEAEGEGLSAAVAGEPAHICLTVSDQYGNPCTPGPQWRFGLGVTTVSGESRSSTKVKLADVAALTDWIGRWSESGEGKYELMYRVEKAGHKELYLWCTPDLEDAADDARLREAIPGVPYSIHVTAGPPVAMNTYCDGWSLADKRVKEGSEKKKKEDDKTVDGASSTIVAGDIVSVRANGIDYFGNPALITESELSAKIVAPDGTEVRLDVNAATRKGGSRKEVDGVNGTSNAYELRHETVLSGTHEMHVLLNGENIQGSPVIFDVEPAAPIPSQSELIAPAEVSNLPADLDKPVVVLLSTCDKFGNKCNTGGLRIAGRLNLVKQSNNDNSILMPNNHSVTIEDLNNGTYEVHVAIMIPATVKLIVNMDKDLPGLTGELPPVQLSFVREESASAGTPAPSAA